MNRKTRRKFKGMTLIELIVVVAIFGLIMTAALVVLGPVGNVYRSAYMYNDSAALVDNVSMYIEDNVRYATRLHICDQAFVSPDDEDAFIAQKVEEFRNYYCFDSTRRVSQFDPNDRIYVMKIANPDIADLDAPVISTDAVSSPDHDASLVTLAEAAESGKISTWEFEAYSGSSSPLEHKEWAVNQQFYNEYAFTSSLDTTIDNYENGFASAFTMNINVFRNERRRGAVTRVSNTNLDNTLSFSLMNVSDRNAALSEEVFVWNDPSDHSRGVRELVDEQFRYIYKNTYSGPDLSDSFVTAGNNIYLFYTGCPDLQSLL